MTLNLLILENDPSQILEMITALKKLSPNINFRIAIDGRQYLTMLFTCLELPDLAILDVRVSEMDGFEVLAAIRRHGYFDYLPIVMFSENASSSNRIKALSLGANEYVVKPSINKIGEKIKEICVSYSKPEFKKPRIESMPNFTDPTNPFELILSELDKIMENL